MIFTYSGIVCKIANNVGNFIWGRSVGNLRYNLCTWKKKIHQNSMSYKGAILWEVYDGFKVAYGSDK